MRAIASAALSFVLIAACGSTQQASMSGGRAAVGVNLASPVFFGSGTTAPANLDVLVENRSGVPITIRSVRIESMGMAQWGIYPSQRMFNETIGAGQTKAFPMFATAQARAARMTMTEPLTVRAIVQFNIGNERYQEIYIGRAMEQ